MAVFKITGFSYLKSLYNVFPNIFVLFRLLVVMIPVMNNFHVKTFFVCSLLIIFTVQD